MILYTSSKHDEVASGYNTAYGADESHFSHKLTTAVIEQLLKRRSEFRFSSCIDIGCGQGELLHYLMNRAGALASTANQPDRFLGVDISRVAIQQAEEKWPSCTWVVDSFQDMVRNGTVAERYPEGVDLIVNKAGLTKVESEEEFVWIHESIRALLADQGCFLYIWSRKFYRKWLSNNTVGWKRDPLQIVFDVFGEPCYLHNPSKYVFLYGGEGHCPPANPFPVRAHFDFDGGRSRSIPLYYDHQLRGRADLALGSRKQSAARAHDHALIGGAGIPLKRSFNSPIRRFANKHLPAGIDFESLEFPIRNSRSLVERVQEFCTGKHTHLIVGGSFTDWNIDPDTGQHYTDPDEFRSRIRWFTQYVLRHQNGRLLFLFRYTKNDSATSEDVEGAGQFRKIMSSIAQEFDVETYDYNTWETVAGRNISFGISLLRRVARVCRRILYSVKTGVRS
jgi:SAM-dependent methyltransferase